MRRQMLDIERKQKIEKCAIMRFTFYQTTFYGEVICQYILWFSAHYRISGVNNNTFLNISALFQPVVSISMFKSIEVFKKKCN